MILPVNLLTKQTKLSLIPWLIVVLFLCRTSVLAESQTNKKADFSHARLGVWTDSGVEYHTKRLYPQAKCVYLESISDMTQNLLQGKIDGFMMVRNIVFPSA